MMSLSYFSHVSTTLTINHTTPPALTPIICLVFLKIQTFLGFNPLPPVLPNAVLRKLRATITTQLTFMEQVRRRHITCDPKLIEHPRRATHRTAPRSSLTYWSLQNYPSLIILIITKIAVWSFCNGKKDGILLFFITPNILIGIYNNITRHRRPFCTQCQHTQNQNIYCSSCTCKVVTRINCFCICDVKHPHNYQTYCDKQITPTHLTSLYCDINMKVLRNWRYP